MRSRDEVLIDRFLQNGTFTLEQYEDFRDAVKRIADHIRELESQQAASEPVAWALYWADGGLSNITTSWPFASQFHRNEEGARAVPLYAHPSAAAVRVTDAMVRAAFVRLYPGCEPDEMQHYHAADIRAALTAALTAASEPVSNAYTLPATVRSIIDAAVAYEQWQGKWYDYTVASGEKPAKQQRALIESVRKYRAALTAASEVQP